MAKNEQKMNRPPIVVVLGHVDHGKTTLLDYLRKTRVAEKEAGGITQSIGASVIEHPSAGTSAELSRTPSGQVRRITFIDTPGHEAFSAMRSRGAKVADVGVLVIAADEGVKPQTEEALSRILEAKLPFLIALTKMDKPEANSERVKTQLSEKGIYVEGWGGNVPVAEISGKTGEGIDRFLDLLLLLSDLEERPYDSQARASGFVLESHHDPRRGITATLIMSDGTLNKGDAIVAGRAVGKVKILEDFRRKPTVSVTASEPALVVGWDSLPGVGVSFQAGADAVAFLEPTTGKVETMPITPLSEDILATLVLKAASAGAVEALRSSVEKVEISGKKPFVLESGIGDVSESDVKRADAAGAMILVFGVDVRHEASRLAEAEGVEIISNPVIYRLLEEFEQKMLHRAEVARESSGEARILAFFREEAGGKIFGARIIRGKLERGNTLVFRGPRELGEAKALNLKEGKQDVEVIEGEDKEFGLLLAGEVKIEIGDVLRQFA